MFAGAPIRGRRTRVCLCVGVVLVAWAALAASSARAQPTPEQDPFYAYQGARPLAAIPPGTVLKTRVIAYHVLGIPLPVRTVQLLYRSSGELGQPTVNVTSVLEPLSGPNPPRVIAYQSFYDSLNPDDEPSYAISGGVTFGGLLDTTETVLIAPMLLEGYTVVVADTEGETADFAAGPEYGYNTLDSLRAALRSGATGLRHVRQIGLMGYSGGAIATEWAAELAPSYAPDVNRLLVGAAMGGVLVDPAHNLHYVSGSSVWAGVMPMAIVGIARAFHVNLMPYMSAYGAQLYDQLDDATIADVLGAYPGLTWQQLIASRYGAPENIPIYDEVVNQLIMGSRGTPTIPLYIAQGADGEIEGTSGDQPGIGEGDGVMIAGDVRTLAREYCARGVTVQYDQYDDLSHTLTALPWIADAGPWMVARFGGQPAPQDCASVAPGNSLAPIPVPTSSSTPSGS